MTRKNSKSLSKFSTHTRPFQVLVLTCIKKRGMYPQLTQNRYAKLPWNGTLLKLMVIMIHWNRHARKNVHDYEINLFLCWASDLHRKGRNLLNMRSLPLYQTAHGVQVV